MSDYEDFVGEAILLTSGQRILWALEEPLRMQTYLQNIMEVFFDGTAGLTLAEPPPLSVPT